MTVEERQKLENSQWHVLKQVRLRFEKWLYEQSWSKRFRKLEFIPHTKFLEIFIFYKTDMDVAEGAANGFSEEIKRKMLSELAELGYPDLVNSDVRFILDSHENVVKNFKGSYFYRLR